MSFSAACASSSPRPDSSTSRSTPAATATLGEARMPRSRPGPRDRGRTRCTPRRRPRAPASRSTRRPSRRAAGPNGSRPARDVAGLQTLDDASPVLPVPPSTRVVRVAESLVESVGHVDAPVHGVAEVRLVNDPPAGVANNGEGATFVNSAVTNERGRSVERREIEIFLTLAEELHFGRTAERLLVSTAGSARRSRSSKAVRYVAVRTYESTGHAHAGRATTAR